MKRLVVRKFTQEGMSLLQCTFESVTLKIINISLNRDWKLPLHPAVAVT